MVRSYFLFILLLPPLLTACSSSPVKVSVSSTRFDNPEVSNEALTVNLALGHGGRTSLTIEDYNYDSDGTDILGFARGNITAAKGLEISIRTDQDSANRIGIKYQFSGQHTEQSTVGNISQAVTLGYEYNTTKKYSSTYPEEICEGPYYCEPVSAHWQHDTNLYDIAWVVGYRFAERDIIYGGPFYQWGKLNGHKNIEEQTYATLKSDGYMIGANIALEHRFSFGMGLAGEIVQSQLNWDGYSKSDTSFNFKIDYQF